MADEEPTLKKVPTETPVLQRKGTDPASDQAKANVAPVGTLAQLVSLNPAHSHVYVTAPVFLLGRSTECHQRYEELSLSGRHCILTTSNGTTTVTDTSTNGTYVNGQRVPKGEPIPLGPGDELCVKASEDADARIAYVYRPMKAGHTTPQSDGAEKRPAVETEAEDRPKKKQKGGDEEMADHMTCGICCDIMYDCVSLLPCLHSFCAACYSDWRKQSNECPGCRVKATSIKRNHTLQNVIEAYLRQHPEKARSAEERKDMDRRNTITKDELTNHQQATHSSQSDDEEDSGSDDEDGVLPMCRQCPGWQGANAGPGFYSCQPGAPHVSCLCCYGLMPVHANLSQLPPAHQKTACDLCRRPFCHQYWGCRCALNPPMATHPVQPSVCLMPLKDRTLQSVPASAFGGNEAETQILRTHLAATNTTPQHMATVCLQALQDGEMPVDDVFTQHPGLARPQDIANAHTCLSCATLLLGELTYQYRAKIPRGDLPESVTGREDCWWGRNCRTAKHKREHAERLNHICAQTRRR